MISFHILTIFPHILDSYLSESILGRAQKNKLIKIQTHDPRAVTTDRHRTVDDKPYGGGPGMIMKVEPIYKTLKKIKRLKKSRVIMLDPAGQQFDQATADKFSRLEQLVFVCGRYEGIDARVEEFIDQRISLGPYILSGGELGAAVIIEAVARLLPGVLGNKESLNEETFSQALKVHSRGRGTKVKADKEYPQYTRPAVFTYKSNKKLKNLKVPEVLLSGDHKAIQDWRFKGRLVKI